MIYLWNIQTRALAATLKTPVDVNTLAFSAEGTRLAASSASGASVYQWNTVTHAALGTVSVPDGWIAQVGYAGSRLGVLNSDGLLCGLITPTLNHHQIMRARRT